MISLLVEHKAGKHLLINQNRREWDSECWTHMRIEAMQPCRTRLCCCRGLWLFPAETEYSLLFWFWIVSCSLELAHVEPIETRDLSSPQAVYSDSSSPPDPGASKNLSAASMYFLGSEGFLSRLILPYDVTSAW